jgi:hypothetical protein
VVGVYLNFGFVLLDRSNCSGALIAPAVCMNQQAWFFATFKVEGSRDWPDNPYAFSQAFESSRVGPRSNEATWRYWELSRTVSVSSLLSQPHYRFSSPASAHWG